jgi:hypothetical protein
MIPDEGPKSDELGQSIRSSWTNRRLRVLYGRRSSVRHSGARAFDLVMKAAWASSSSGGGGSVRDVTG